jgi:hypothetical protein
MHMFSGRQAGGGIPKLKTNYYMQKYSDVSQLTFYHEMKPKI